MRMMDQAMRTRTNTLLAAIAAIGLVAAHAEPRDWTGHGHDGRYDRRGGNAATGALIGIGVGALSDGAIVASQQLCDAPPPLAYHPPTAYHPAPALAPPPGY
jgi:hypothetical protein